MIPNNVPASSPSAITRYGLGLTGTGFSFACALDKMLILSTFMTVGVIFLNAWAVSLAIVAAISGSESVAVIFMTCESCSVDTVILSASSSAV